MMSINNAVDISAKILAFAFMGFVAGHSLHGVLFIAKRQPVIAGILVILFFLLPAAIMWRKRR